MSWFSEKVGKPFKKKLKKPFGNSADKWMTGNVGEYFTGETGGRMTTPFKQIHRITGTRQERKLQGRREAGALTGAGTGAATGFMVGGPYGALLGGIGGGVMGYQSNKPATGRRLLQEGGKGVLAGLAGGGVANLYNAGYLFGSGVGTSGSGVAGANGGNLLGTGINPTWTNSPIAGTGGATWGSSGTALGSSFGWKDLAKAVLRSQGSGGQGGQQYPEEQNMSVYSAYTSPYLGQYSPFNPVKYRTYGGGAR